MLKFLFFMIFIFFNFKKFWDMKYLIILMFLMFMIMMFPSFYSMLMFSFFMDFLSYGMILLTFWISFLMFLASEKILIKNNLKYLFSNFILILMILLILSFSTKSIMLFYIFFEMSLIPTFYLILGWGYQPERLQASFYLLFYTLAASLPLLMSIFILNYNYNSFIFMILNFKYEYNLYLYILLVMAFLVKMPMFLVHLWLPKAHVEAPISGSMILAGVLLKLGGYGLLRIFYFLAFFNNLNLIWMTISLMGSFLVSLNCLKQSDLKSLIAYSSVVHMGLIILAMFNFSYWSILNAYLMMIAHGLCSSGLFCLANITYERTISRSILINKGLLSLMPSMSMWWFLLCSSNMSAPPSLNLLSEVGLLNSIINWSNYTMLIIMMFSFFSASYCLYLFSYTQHGKFYSMKFSFSNNLIREYLLIFLHWFPLNILILKSEMFVIWL